MTLTKEKKQELETKIEQESGMDFDAIGEFALNNKLDYDSALLVLSGEATMEQALEMLESLTEEVDYLVPFVETDNIEAVCDYVAQVAKEMESESEEA